MKKASLLTIGCVLLAQCLWAQSRQWERLKKVEENYYVEDNGKEYLANSSVVTRQSLSPNKGMLKQVQPNKAADFQTKKTFFQFFSQKPSFVTKKNCIFAFQQ
jgi:hypothetical protein